MGPIRQTRAPAALYGTVFVDLLGFTLVLPSLPFQVTDLGGNAIWLGVVLTSYSLCQAVAAPVLGRLADRHGRRRLLLLSLAGSTVSLALMGLAGSLWLLLAARAAAGICGGSIGVANAFAAQLAGADGRTRVMGRVGAAVGLAFTIGPALGALAAPLGFAVIALVGAGLALLNLVVAAALLPPGRTETHRPAAAGRRRVAPWRLLAAGFGAMAAFVGMETTVAYLAAARFDAGPALVGVLLALAGLTLVVVQGFLVAPAARRWGETRVATTGAALMAAGLLAMPLLAEVPFVVAVLVVSAGNGMLTTTVASLLAGAGPPRDIGARMGQGQSAAAAARAAGPLTAGALFDAAMIVPYLLGALLSLGVAWCVSAGTRERQPTAKR
ncbi:MFS transporter [Actinophytocola gossypii]|uniref:MFS transporter n=1 Tax=Actinophytocola gossypii TaxID=2812003 RepID=A0ABT2JIE8_9PSEU|nr:MFS transporter [Actinophytocola gossypii]MCT2587170.1 MFS transporter [Actinophytocola gossypii]